MNPDKGASLITLPPVPSWMPKLRAALLHSTPESRGCLGNHLDRQA